MNTTRKGSVDLAGAVNGNMLRNNRLDAYSETRSVYKLDPNMPLVASRAAASTFSVS